MNARLLAAGGVVALASVASARGGDDAAARIPLKDLRARAATAYEKSRTALAEIGKKAATAADAGDYLAWKPANDSYMAGLQDLQLVCENAVRDLSTKASDVGDVG